MKTENTKLLLLAIYAFWSSSMGPLATHIYELQEADKYPRFHCTMFKLVNRDKIKHRKI